MVIGLARRGLRRRRQSRFVFGGIACLPDASSRRGFLPKPLACANPHVLGYIPRFVRRISLVESLQHVEHVSR